MIGLSLILSATVLFMVALASSAFGGILVALIMLAEVRAYKTRNRNETKEFIALAAELYHLKMENLNAKTTTNAATNHNSEVRPRRQVVRSVRNNSGPGPNPVRHPTRNPDGDGLGITSPSEQQGSVRDQSSIHKTVRL